MVLTGTMEDGTAGLQAIKACDGLAVVQDPAEALAPEMPASAMRYVAVDHCLPISDIGKLLMDWTRRPLPMGQHTAPSRLSHEMWLHTGQGDAVQHLEAIAHPSPFVCPDCRGGLWQIDGTQPVRYRCHTGHGFTLATLQQALTETMDEALWTAVRSLREQSVLLAMLAIANRNTGDTSKPCGWIWCVSGSMSSAGN